VPFTESLKTSGLAYWIKVILSLWNSSEVDLCSHNPFPVPERTSKQTPKRTECRLRGSIRCQVANFPERFRGTEVNRGLHAGTDERLDRGSC
jgi:hypothetical protein